MARKIKIDNSIIKRRSYKRGKKRIGERNIREYILIVCEGTKTEPNYFEAIKKTFPKNTVETYDIDIQGTGSSTLKIIEIAIDIREKALKNQNKTFDEVWVVFDKDSFPEDDFNNAIYKARANKIKTAWSNEAFELWYILHFQYRNTAMSREDYKRVIEIEINKSILSQTGKSGTFVYTKNNPEMYYLLQSHGNETQAINWAKQLDSLYSDEKHANHNPNTQVFKLIEKLNTCKEIVTTDSNI